MGKRCPSSAGARRSKITGSGLRRGSIETLELRLVLDSTVVFSEVMYNPPAGNTAGEWIELFNQNSLDMDLSNWSLAGGVEYTFPVGTVLPGKGYLVVAASPDALEAATGYALAEGPFSGALSNSGEKLELRNNGGRLIDSLDYSDDGPWTVGPDGSGFTLAKSQPNTGTEPAANWTVSAQPGGTPGAANFVDPLSLPRVFDTLIGPSAAARVLIPTQAAQVPANWNTAAFDDQSAGWLAKTTGVGFDSSGQYMARGVLNANGNIGPQMIGVNASAFVRIPFQVADPTNLDSLQLGLDYDDGFVAYLNGVEVARRNAPAGTPAFNATATQQSVATTIYRASDDLLAMEIGAGGATNPNGVWTYGGRASAAGPFTAYTAAQHLDNWGSLLPTPHTGGKFQGYGFDTAVAVPAIVVNTTNVGDSPCCGITPIDPHKIFTHPGPGGSTYDFPTVRWTAPAAGTVTYSGNWIQRHSTQAAVYVRVNGLQVFSSLATTGAGTTYAPAARTVAAGDTIEFVVGPHPTAGYGATSTQFEAVMNFSPTPGPGQFAHVDLDLTGFLGNLQPGGNVLSIQALNVGTSDADLLVRPQLVARELPPPVVLHPNVVLSEIAAAGSGQFFVEVANNDTQSVNLAGYVLQDVDTQAEYTLSTQTLAPGAIASFTSAQLGFTPASGDRLLLMTPLKTHVVDAHAVTSRLRGLSAEHGDEWLFPSAATPGAANAFALASDVVINEIMHDPRSTQLDPAVDTWIELFNRGATTIDLSGWQLTNGIEYTFPAGTLIAPQGYLVVAKDAAYLQPLYPGVQVVGNFSGSLAAEDTIELVDINDNPADRVSYFSNGRWPEAASGGGASLELRNPGADNAAGEVWAASDEASKSGWQTYSYRQFASADNGPGIWNELVLGMLDAGDVLIDDVSVLRNPAGAATQLIQNGSFQADALGGPAANWRVLGNHQGTVVVDPANPNNRVLRIVATGTTETQSNHAETTFVGNTPAVNGTEYEVSFKAKWLGGSDLLNTRFYLARVAKTVVLDTPEYGGTPGAKNSTYLANVGPTYSDMQHAQVLPEPNDPVQVSIRAADPQGIAALTLWYRVGAGAWFSLPMTAGAGGMYSAIIPGQSASAVVQFYVSGQDSAGATSTFPAAGAASRALYKVNDGVLATTPIDTIRLIMNEAEATNLFNPAVLMSNQLVGATVIYNNSEIFYDVGVRLKGSPFGRTYGDRQDSYYIQFHGDHLFRGVQEVIELDGSGVGALSGGGPDELIINQLLNRTGGPISVYNDLGYLIAPNPAHNGPKILMLSRYSNQFFDESFENGSDGQHFEMEIINHQRSTLNGLPDGIKNPNDSSWVGWDVGDFGNDKEKYRWNFLIKNHRDQDDYSRLIEFSKAFSLTGAGLDTATRALMDIDEWMWLYAIISLTGNRDVYTSPDFGAAAHNMRLYIRPEDGRVLALPWDQDYAFVAPINAPLHMGFNLAKIIDLPANLRVFYGHLQDIIETSANAGYIAPYVQQIGELSGFSYGAGHVNYIQQRADYVTGQLAIVAPQINFQINTNGGANFTTAASTTTITGQGWINVREIRLGNGQVLTPTWTSQTAWQVTVPLVNGANPLTFAAFDYQGRPAGSDSITITSTANGPSQLAQLRITELMYHAADGAPGGPYVNSDYEYIELQNIGASSLPLGQAKISGGVSFTFPAMTLAPGAFVLVVNNQAAFESRYGTGMNIAGEFSGNLNNGGEQLVLTGSLGEAILDFTYDPAWAATTDGAGPSLVVVNSAAATATWNTAAAWRASHTLSGSPGSLDPAANVLARQVFYNNSKFDGNSAAAGANDDLAIAADKAALLPGGVATSVNYTSYSRGINGVMVDIAGLAGQLTAADFEFRIGNDDTPAAWDSAVAPQVINVRMAAGVLGSSRVTLVWPDCAIQKQWLQVIVKATGATGLSAPDVFYFGNAVGESGDNAASAVVNGTDEVAARNHPRTFLDPAALDNVYDFNRDGFVNATDQIIARSNSTTLATALKLIIVPSGIQASASSAPSGLLSEERPLTYANIASGLVALAKKTEGQSATALHETLSQVIWTAPATSTDAGVDRRQISQLANTDRSIVSPGYELLDDEELFDQIATDLVKSHL